MQGIDLTKPGEKKKLVGAVVLGVVAIAVLYWVLIGFDSGTPTTTPRPTPSSAQQQQSPRSTQTATRTGGTATEEVATLLPFRPVVYQPSSYNAPEARRNIFAYYVPPVVEQKAPATPPPPPTPTPPVLLASVSPSNVYARTADFKLELAGDKFSPALRVYIDGRELPTSYKNPQQVSTTVPAAFIASPGTRAVMVRTPDNQLYSNSMQISVADPPKPNYVYVGIIGRTNRVDDVALVQERNNKNIINVLRGDILSGRFRVTSISEKELVLTDTTLKIKHTIGMSEGERASGPLARPTPRVDAEDDEP
ncbi:MAG TPA: IPT/TIG domain-containing protein [Pyrinomonadaceae bacterium]|nr:IPT/TIG domain-containing protein [Pyrinomonadaceae bacterium]